MTMMALRGGDYACLEALLLCEIRRLALLNFRFRFGLP